MTQAPSASLNSSGMSSKVATLYGANMSVLASATDWPRSKTSGARSRALELLGGVDLVLAGAVGLVGVDLDVVLVLERLDDVAVVGPVRRQRDDVELALLLRGLDQRVHAAEVLGRGRGLGVGAAAAAAAALSSSSAGGPQAASAAVARERDHGDEPVFRTFTCDLLSRGARSRLGRTLAGAGRLGRYTAVGPGGSDREGRAGESDRRRSQRTLSSRGERSSSSATPTCSRPARTTRRTGWSPPRASRPSRPTAETFLQVAPEAIQRLTAEAMHDISHYLRPAHLAQLRKIIDDPEASGNDRFVALDLLKNVNISAGGVLPMCQDTGTAIVMGKKSEGVLTGADDGEAISPRRLRRLHQAQPALLAARAADDVRGEEHRHQPAGADRALLDAADVRASRSTSSSSWPRAAARPTSRSSSRRPRRS